MTESPRIGFLGAGKMATALAGGWLKAGLATPERLCASDPLAEARTAFEEHTGATAFEDNSQVLDRSDVVVLAIKPQQTEEVLRQMRGRIGAGKLVVSIVAGVTLKLIEDLLAGHERLIRVMPNTPCLVGSSASAFAASAKARAEDVQLVERLLGSVGRVAQVPEKLLDAVTGLSGSGPAYVFVMIEALSDGGVRMGLPRDLATLLAAQTVLGAAQMVLEMGLHPSALKDMVASPGGTTIAGLHALERGGVRAALMDAVEAATRRSVELGK